MQDSLVSGKDPSKRFSFDTAATLSLAITAALAIILFIPGITVPLAYVKVTLLSLGTLVSLIFFILARLTRGNIIVPPLSLIGALWLLPIAYGLSTLFSGVNLQKAFFGNGFDSDTFGFILLLAVFTTIAALSMRRPEHYRTFFSIAAGALGILFIGQIVIEIISRIPNTVSPLVSLVGPLSDLAMLSGLGTIIALVALRFLSFTGRAKKVLIGFLVLALVVTVMVNSLTAWILIGLAALGFFIESIMHRKISSEDEDLEGVATLAAETEIPAAKSSEFLVIPLATLVVALVFIIGNSTIGTAVVNALGTGTIDARPSWQSTFDVGSHTYAAAPLFGSGPGTFGEVWLKYRDRGLNDTVFWGIDFPAGVGYIPTSFVTIGAAGVFAWLVFLGLFLFLGFRALLFRASTDRVIRFTSITSFVGALYVLVLATIAIPGPAVLAFGFVLVGIFVSTLRFGNERKEWGVIFSKNPRVGFVLVFLFTLLLLGSVLGGYVVTERYFALQSYGDASAALAKNDIATADLLINRSLLFGPTDVAYHLAVASGIAHMNKIASDTSLPASSAQQQFQTVLSNALANGTAATKLDPNNYQNWAVLGNVYQTVVPLKIEGAYEQAKAAYAKAMALNPTNAVLPYIVAQLDIAHGDTAAAEKDLTDSISLKHDYTPAILLLSQLKVQEGKAKEALQAAEAAAYFAPNDAAVQFQVGILRSGTGDTDGAIDSLNRAIELNAQYANAHFFLGVMYALKGNYAKALAELKTVASFSDDNAKAVADDIATLQSGKNPFPASRLGALGIPGTAITEPAPTVEKKPAGATPAPSTAK